jgi:MFS family permease
MTARCLPDAPLRSRPYAEGMTAGTVARARAALASHDFRVLLAARLGSQFADGLFQAFLVNQLVFLSPEGQSTAVGVAKAAALLIVPFSLMEPFTGVVIDRWSRRRILTVTPLVRAVCSAVLVPIVVAAGSHATIPLYAVTLVALALNRFYLATAGAVMPALVPDEDLLIGNALAGTLGTVLTFVGLVTGTQIATTIHNSGLLAITAALWPLSALAASRLHVALRPAASEEGLTAQVRRVTRELVAGARRLAATPAALGAVGTMAWDQLLFGMITVLSVVVFRDEFKEGVASYGRIIGAGGVGLIVGAATIGLLERRLSKPRIVAASCVIAGAACLLGALRVTAPIVLLVGFVLGTTYPWRKVPVDTIVQETIPDRFLGRVFTIYDLAFSMPRVVAALIAIALLPSLSAAMVLAIVGVAYLAWTPILPYAVRRPRWVGVRFYAGGRADESPRAIVIGGEEEAVEAVGSWTEEVVRGTARTRRRRLRLRFDDGSVAEVTAEDGTARWQLSSEVSARTTDEGTTAP